MRILTIMTLCIMTLSGAAFAEGHNLQISSDTIESQLCLDAATGKKTLDEIANNLSIDTNSLDRRISCNNMKISKFVKKYNDVLEEASYVKTENNNELKALHANQDANLCVIAATGNISKMNSMARIYGTNVKHFVKFSRCNDLSVLEFVSQYGGKQALANLKNTI